jgi:hypothetical protein
MEQALTTLEEPMLKDSIKALVGFMRPLLLPGDITRIKKILLRGIEADSYHRDTFGMHPLINGFSTALELCHSVSPDRSMVIAIMLLCAVNAGSITMDELKKDWDEDITDTVGRLPKIYA